jgi:hypothetical protein
VTTSVLLALLLQTAEENARHALENSRLAILGSIGSACVAVISAVIAGYIARIHFLNLKINESKEIREAEKHRDEKAAKREKALLDLAKQRLRESNQRDLIEALKKEDKDTMDALDDELQAFIKAANKKMMDNAESYRQRQGSWRDQPQYDKEIEAEKKAKTEEIEGTKRLRRMNIDGRMKELENNLAIIVQEREALERQLGEGATG